jgi:hypothetical protein
MSRKTKKQIKKNIMKTKKTKCELEIEKIREERRKFHEEVRKSLKKPIHSKKKVEEIFNQYEIKGTKKKRLVVCHGKKHKRKFRCALTLNRANVLKPDIVSDLWSPRAMNYLRPNYFDTIIMEHCPLENPFQKRNNKVWKNLYRILKKDGKIINESILGLYGINVKDKWFHDMTKEEQKETKKEVNEHIKKLGFRQVRHIHAGMKYPGHVKTIMTK